MKKTVIIGAGGFGRQVLTVLDDINQDSQQYEPLGFVVQAQYGKPGDIVNDQPILGDLTWLERYSKEIYVVCALGEPQHRRRIIEIVKPTGVRFCTLIHPSVIMSRWVILGEGVFIGQGSMLADQIRIGDHAIIVGASTVGHDVVIEDFATITHGVHVSGNVTIHTGSYIGVGTNIVDRVSIGAWSIIGAGSTVIKPIPANTTAVGVPAVVIKERPAGWHLQAQDDLG